MVKRCFILHDLMRPWQLMLLTDNYFHQTFHRDHQVASIPKKIMTDHGHHTDPDGVAKLLRYLQNGKAPGPDKLRKTHLTINIKMTAEGLSLIYNKSIEQGGLPLDWKTAHVTPVYKSGSQHSASNCRPISQTSIPCKLLEHILLGDILKKDR